MTHFCVTGDFTINDVTNLSPVRRGEIVASATLPNGSHIISCAGCITNIKINNNNDDDNKN